MGSGLVALQMSPGQRRSSVKQPWSAFGTAEPNKRVRTIARRRCGKRGLMPRGRPAAGSSPACGRDSAPIARRTALRLGTAPRRPLAASAPSRDMVGGMGNESDQVNRAISTGQLHALPRFHIRPIDVVVFHGSQGSTRFKVGFPLRCLQRLSRPFIATLHCGWRHNSSTRGTFIPVLSY